MMKTCSLAYSFRGEKSRSGWMKKHPVLSGVLMLVGVPAGMILSVGIFTAAVMYPISSLMGWL